MLYHCTCTQCRILKPLYMSCLQLYALKTAAVDLKHSLNDLVRICMYMYMLYVNVVEYEELLSSLVPRPPHAAHELKGLGTRLRIHFTFMYHMTW